LPEPTPMIFVVEDDAPVREALASLIPLRLLPDGNDVHRFRGGLPGGALRRVRAYIDDHLGERISLDQLAR
jgi:hypothetical protein